MHDALYPTEGPPAYLINVHGKAVREFITRTVTAHVLIFCWYRNITAKSFLASGCLRWPHCTRATLIERGSERLLSRKTLKGTPQPHSLWMVREVLMPNILTPILLKAGGEPDPLKVITYDLQELVSGKRYEMERQLIEEIISLLNRGKDQAARGKIGEFVKKATTDRKPIKYSLSFFGTKIEWEGSSRGVGHIVKQGGLRWQDYERAARDVFPHLFKNPKD